MLLYGQFRFKNDKNKPKANKQRHHWFWRIILRRADWFEKNILAFSNSGLYCNCLKIAICYIAQWAETFFKFFWVGVPKVGQSPLRPKKADCLPLIIFGNFLKWHFFPIRLSDSTNMIGVWRKNLWCQICSRSTLSNFWVKMVK